MAKVIVKTELMVSSTTHKKKGKRITKYVYGTIHMANSKLSPFIGKKVKLVVSRK